MHVLDLISGGLFKLRKLFMVSCFNGDPIMLSGFNPPNVTIELMDEPKTTTN